MHLGDRLSRIIQHATAQDLAWPKLESDRCHIAGHLKGLHCGREMPRLNREHQLAGRHEPDLKAACLVRDYRTFLIFLMQVYTMNFGSGDGSAARILDKP